MSFLDEDGRAMALRFRVLDTAVSRLVGLLGTKRGEARAVPCLLVRCRSVHTFGMSYAIDVALVDERGVVVASKRRVPAGRVVGAKAAAHALERPSSNAPWPRVGDEIGLDLLDEGVEGSAIWTDRSSA